MTTFADIIANPSSANMNPSLGRVAAAGSRSLALCNEDAAFLAALGAIGDTAWASGNGTLVALLKAIAANAVSTADSPVVVRTYTANSKYEPIAASQSAQVMGGSGAIGDYLSHVVIIPATTSPGAVSITDGSGSAITIFTGGSSSVASLVPFPVPLGLASTSGAWKITTGANVSAIGAGNFT